MSGSEAAGAAGVEVPPEADFDAIVDGLRAQGATRFDPVGFRFIEALARRATACRGGARRLLARRLEQSVADYRGRFERAQREAGEALARGVARFPEAADGLRQHCEAGDLGALRRLLARLEARGGGGPLAELLGYLRRHAAEATEAGGEGAVDAPDVPAAAPAGELKALRYFRSTWSRLSLDHQLSHAFAQAPENAGPLNSHYLVLQALKTMRDTGPAYLEQLVSYVDALLWLERAESGRAPAQKAAARGERDKKRKPARGKPA